MSERSSTSNVLRLSEHPRSAVSRGIAALATGGPIAAVIDGAEAALGAVGSLERLVGAFKAAAGRPALTHAERVRLYSVCARATAVIPATYSIEADCEAHGGFREEYLRQQATYHCFTPAWELADVLEKTFGKEDPGKVIGQHMAMLFDRSRLEDPNLYVHFLTGTRADGANLASAMLGWAGRAENLPARERLVCQFLESRLTELPAATVLESLPAVITALAVPQALFTTFINAVIDYEVIDLNRRTSSINSSLLELLVFLLLSCTHVPTGSDTARKNSKAAVEHLNLLAGAIQKAASEKQDGEAAKTLMAALSSTMAAAADVIRDRSEARDTAPLLPPQLLPRLVSVGDVFETLNETIWIQDPLKAHLHAAANYRQSVLSGYSSIELEESYLLSEIVSLHWHEYDLAIQLSQLWMSGSYSDGEVTALPAWFGSKDHDRPEDLERRVESYSALYNAAKADGLLELAAAIAAFFVFSQALRYGGRLGAWSKVGSLLTDAIDLPRVEMLETAIVVAREHARSRNETILEKRLDSLVTHAKRRRTRRHDMPVVNPAFGASSPEHVRELLEARFGRTRVQRLSTKALRFWTNAHAKEAANRGQQVLGIVEEWGSVAEDLCKPFEATLADRLADIYRDERYREVLAKQKKKPAAKPTLGNYLFLMYDYKRLPGEMKTMMDSRMSIHKLPGVLKSLKELLERHRNAGAHPDPYGLRQLNELMEMLYEKDRGLWDRFLDGLTDAAVAESIAMVSL